MSPQGTDDLPIQYKPGPCMILYAVPLTLQRTIKIGSYNLARNEDPTWRRCPADKPGFWVRGVVIWNCGLRRLTVQGQTGQERSASSGPSPILEFTFPPERLRIVDGVRREWDVFTVSEGCLFLVKAKFMPINGVSAFASHIPKAVGAALMLANTTKSVSIGVFSLEHSQVKRSLLLPFQRTDLDILHSKTGRRPMDLL